jgi:excisionase family DNA binding protein
MAILTGEGSAARGTRPRTVQEAAQALGLSVHTVRAWIAQRRIAHIRLGRAVRISADEIDRVLNDGTIPRHPTSMRRSRT